MKQTSAVIAALIVLLLLLIAGGAVWFLYANPGGLVASVIALEVTEATQTEIGVGPVSIDLGAGRVDVSRLTIANPDGFSDRPAISLDGFAIDLDPLAVLADPLVIERIRVDSAHVLIEQGGAENNLRTILSSVERVTADQPRAAEPEGKKLIVERFEVTGARATLLAPRPGERREIRLPDVVLADIGHDTDGATVASVAGQLLEPLIRTALESAAADADALHEQSGIAEGPLDRGGDPEDGRGGEQ